MKTENDFKETAKTKGIHFWRVHDCSMCGYECGFLFDGDLVGYDNGCYCTSYHSGPQPRDWKDVANHYNRQKNPVVIRKMDEFWGFTPLSEEPKT